MPGGKMPKLQR